MTMKPFEIQSTSLSIGGVKIDTSSTGALVLPGVTRAGTSVAIEVNDTQDQSYSWTGTPVVIDGYTYATTVIEELQAQVGWTAATYEIDGLDGEGYIDGISIVDGGTGYTGEAVTFSSTMWAANEGTQIDPSTNGQWIEIPFSVRCGAGSIESEFGGGGGASALEQLNDVNISDPQDGQALVWNNQSEQWENQTVSGGNANTGDITFDGTTISSTTGYPTLVNAPGADASAGGVEIDFDSSTVSHAMWLNGEDGFQIQINRHLNDGPGSGGSSNWNFSVDGALTFPDGSKQTTAYTGQVIGSQPLYIMANVDGTVLTSNDGISWSGPFNSGAPSIHKVEIHNGVIVYSCSNDGPFAATGLYFSTEIGVATLCAGTDTLFGDNLSWNELHHIPETDKWVAVGFAQGSYRYPVVAHSTDGISWAVLAMDGTAFANLNPSNNDWVFNDVTYSTVDSTYVIIGTMSNGFSGIFVTNDITVQLNENNFLPVQANLYEIIKWNVEQYGGPAGYMLAMSDDNGLTLWGGISPVSDPNSWSSQGDGQTGFYESSMMMALNYIPTVGEMTYNYNNFLITTGDGQVMVPGIGGPGFISVPLPYTATNFSIDTSSTASFTLINGAEQPAGFGEKFVISNANPSEFNGTYYAGQSTAGTVFQIFTDTSLAVPFDTTGLGAFVSGTITYSHGQYIDAAGVDVNGYYYIGNDDEQVFRSTDNGITWNELTDVDGVYFNDFAYGSFGTISFNNAELIGDGASSQVGITRVVGTNFQGFQGGESTTVLLAAADAAGFAVGDTISFRKGEVRTITSFGENGDTTFIGWEGEVGGESPTDPRYPITLTTANYSPATKNTARIKPDSSLADIGQYMEIYTGGAPVLDDTGHIHMKGRNGNVELFLGTDNNFVSVKEAGSMPAGVNLRSENDVTVTDSNLKLSHNGSWVSVYGDGENYNSNGDSSDLVQNTITSDKFGDYYVGGEHCYNADAYISKYSRDGSLLWNKLANSNNIPSYTTLAVAHHGDEVATIVRTNYNRSWYVKLVILDSETGDIKSTTDVYDNDNGLDAYGLIYHSTLGWTIVGENYGEVGTVTEVPGIGNTGIGMIEVTGASVLIGGRYPEYSNDWTISGTNISGDQSLNNRAVGLYRDLPLTTVTGAGTGGTLTIRCQYNNNNWWFNYQNEGTGNNGTGYTQGDIVKIPGSLLGGVNNAPVSGLAAITPTGIDNGYLFDKVTFPTLDTQIQQGDFIIDNTTNKIVVSTGAPQTYYNDSTKWIVYVYVPFGNLDAPAGDVTVTRGNDFMTAVTSTDTFSSFDYAFGMVSHETIRIDMADMGYTTDDFTGGQFTFNKTLNGRPFVWNNSWQVYLEPPAENNSNGNGFARCVAEDTWSGGLIVGGYLDNGTNSGSLVWKLDSAGNTVWAKSITDDDNDVISIAVSPINGSIYVGTRYSSVCKLSSSGDLTARAAVDGSMFWLNDPVVTIEKDNFGVEHILVGGRGSSNWGTNTGFIVTKLTTDLTVIWSREMATNMSGLSTNYGYNLTNVEFSKGQATLVGYREIPYGNRTRGLMYTMDISDSFTNFQSDEWYISTIGVRWIDPGTHTTFDLIDAGGSGKASSIVSEANTESLSWSNWTYQSARYNLNPMDQLVEGVGGIRFSDGGLLDHNPVDIPPSLNNSKNNWNYTLKLSDRGRFIMNQTIPNNSSCQDLYITVPLNENVPFPVGTVITLINSNDSNAGGYSIYVQPENYADSNSPRIYATGFANYSTWSFQGIQTATLMKINSNGWLLTASNIVNRD